MLLKACRSKTALDPPPNFGLASNGSSERGIRGARVARLASPGVEPPISARIWLPSTTEVDQSIFPAPFSWRRARDGAAPTHPRPARPPNLRCAVAGETPSRLADAAKRSL